MLNEKLPNDLLYPDSGMGLAEIALEYRKSVSTIQRVFKRLGVYELLGRTDGRSFSPEEVFIIFFLYFPPSKYYATFLYLEQVGYIEVLKKKFNVDEFLTKRRKEKEK